MFEFLEMGALMTAATAGYVVYYGMGMVYFYLITHLVTLQPIGWKAIVLVYCLPEMPADYILCILAAIMARRCARWYRRICREK